MKNSNTRSIFDGDPVTTETIDNDGNKTITVNIEALNPFMAKVADGLTKITTGITAVAAIIGSIAIQDVSITQQVIMLALPIPVYFIAQRGFYKLLSRTIPVKFTPKTHSFRKGFTIKSFDVAMGIKYIIEDHPQNEREKLAYALKEEKRDVKWYSRPLKPYRQNASALILEYMGQPNLIAYVYPTLKAKAYVARLTAVSDVMARHGSASGGVALSPRQEWESQAGTIIDHKRSVS